MTTFISRISGIEYKFKKDKGFQSELINNGLTLETYCYKYLTNVAQE